MAINRKTLTKRFLGVMGLCVLSFGMVACSGDGGGIKEPDYSTLTADNHPRVIYTDSDFSAIAQQVAEGTNPYLTEMHEIILKEADSHIGEADIERVMLGKRLLDVSQAAMKRILSCTYAYKTTGEGKYLAQAEHDICSVCNFSDWNAVMHYLDAGEMSATVGLAYDWMYNDLADSTKVLARKAINDFGFSPALNNYDELWNKIYDVTNNWNSVCNGGLVCAALAVYEDNPEIAQTIIDKALESNVACMKDSYSPDGNYPEGYGYWGYGTLFEALLLTAMETATGSDNGLSDIEGFSKTGDFIIHMEGPSGCVFNFSDNRQKTGASPALWYFAWKYGDMSVLYSERNKVSSYANRLLPLIAWYASKVDVTNVPAPKENIYHGEGMTPVVLVHDTWTMDENDKFLGVKGGLGTTPHAHLDAGSFVFDAEGLRWASELGQDAYGRIERYLNLWAMKDGSERWQVFRYNNFNHNTLTINDTYQKVAGNAKILEVIDSDGKRGAVIDITEPLGEEVAEAVRTIYIEGDDLIVEDKITAPEGKPANVRWTMVTPAEPTVGSHAVTLVQGDKTRYLTCSSSTGHEVEWTTWSAQSDNEWDGPNPGFHECGYTTTVNAGDTAVIAVRLGLDDGVTTDMKLGKTI